MSTVGERVRNGGSFSIVAMICVTIIFVVALICIAMAGGDSTVTVQEAWNNMPSTERSQVCASYWLNPDEVVQRMTNNEYTAAELDKLLMRECDY